MVAGNGQVRIYFRDSASGHLCAVRWTGSSWAAPVCQPGRNPPVLTAGPSASWDGSRFQVMYLANDTSQIETLAGTIQHTRFPKPRDGPLDQTLFVAIHTLRRRGDRLYFIDDPNRIRMIENDRVTTINPLTQPGMRDGPLDQALFDRPWALALFGSTGLLVSDAMNCRLRLIQLAE